MEVVKEHDANNFIFHAVNGDWRGSFNEDRIVVEYTKMTIEQCSLLEDDHPQYDYYRKLLT